MQSILFSFIVNIGNLTVCRTSRLPKKKQNVMDFQFAEEKRVDYCRKGFSDEEIEQLAAFSFHEAVLPPRMWGVSYRRDDAASDRDDFGADYSSYADPRRLPLLKPIVRKEMALEAIGLYRNALSHCEDYLFGDSEIILKAMQFDWLDAFYQASQDLKRDPVFLVKAVSLQWCVIELIEPVLRLPEVVRAAFQRSGFAYEYLSEQDKRDPANILSAVSRDGRALQSVAEHLRSKAVVLAALKNDLQCFEFVPDVLLKDREVIFASLARRGVAYWVISSIEPTMIDLAIARKALSTDVSVYSLLPHEIQRDYGLALETVYSDASVYSDLPACIQSNPWLALVAFSKNHYFALKMPESLRDGKLSRYMWSLVKEHEAFMLFMLASRTRASDARASRRKTARDQVLGKLNDNGPYFAIVFKRMVAEFAGVKIGKDFLIVRRAERYASFLL